MKNTLKEQMGLNIIGKLLDVISENNIPLDETLHDELNAYSLLFDE